jgi:hypothetical protein
MALGLKPVPAAEVPDAIAAVLQSDPYKQIMAMAVADGALRLQLEAAWL